MVAIVVSLLLALTMVPAVGIQSALADEPAERPATTGGDVPLEGPAENTGLNAEEADGPVTATVREDGSLVAEGLVYKSESNGAVLVGFEDGNALEREVAVPERLTDGALEYTVKGVSVAEGQTAPGVLSLTLPQTVEDVDTKSLAASMPALARVSVDGRGGAYSSANGMLFRQESVTASSDGSTTRIANRELVWAPPAMVIARIPGTCKTVASGAFVDDKALETVMVFSIVEGVAKAEKEEGGNVTKEGAFTDEQVSKVNIVTPMETVVSSEGERINADAFLAEDAPLNDKHIPWCDCGFSTDRFTVGIPYGSSSLAVAVPEDGKVGTPEITIGHYTDHPEWDPKGDTGEPQNGLVFEYKADMTVSVAWKGDKAAVPAHLELPAYVIENGVKTAVTEIAPNAFEGATQLESVVIPEGITTVGESAFAGCSNLRDAPIPSTLKVSMGVTSSGLEVARQVSMSKTGSSSISQGALSSTDTDGSGPGSFVDKALHTLTDVPNDPRADAPDSTNSLFPSLGSYSSDPDYTIILPPSSYYSSVSITPNDTYGWTTDPTTVTPSGFDPSVIKVWTNNNGKADYIGDSSFWHYDASGFGRNNQMVINAVYNGSATHGGGSVGLYLDFTVRAGYRLVDYELTLAEGDIENNINWDPAKLDIVFSRGSTLILYPKFAETSLQTNEGSGSLGRNLSFYNIFASRSWVQNTALKNNVNASNFDTNVATSIAGGKLKAEFGRYALSDGNATQDWVNTTALADNATKTWVSSTALKDNATQSWVTGTALKDNATQTWVKSTDQLTKYETRTVAEGKYALKDGNATQSWVEGKGYTPESEFGSIAYANGSEFTDRAVMPTSYKMGGMPAIPEPEKDGYEFAGWKWSRSNCKNANDNKSDQTGNLADAFGSVAAADGKTVTVTLTAQWRVPEAEWFFSEGAALDAGGADKQTSVIRVRLSDRQRNLATVNFEANDATGLVKADQKGGVVLWVNDSESAPSETNKKATLANGAIGATGIPLVKFDDGGYGLYVGIEVPAGAVDPTKVTQSYAAGDYVASLVKLNYTFA